MRLELTGVGFSRDGLHLLQDLDLCVEKGSVTVLLGPNGAGKSTLIKLIGGTLIPTSGTIMMDGNALASYPRELRSRRVAVLTQQVSLEFPFTVAEVVAMGRIPHAGLRRQKIVAELLDRFALDGHRFYTSLSGGERQMVQIARVLAQIWDQGSDVLLLLDEPTAPLDLRHQQLVMSVLHELRSRGVAQVMVMHDVNLAATNTSQIVLLAEGKIIAQGTPDEVLTETNLYLTFGVAMQMVRDPASGRRFFVAPETPG